MSHTNIINTIYLPFLGLSKMQTSSFLPPPTPVSSFPPSALSLSVFSEPSGLFSSLPFWIQSLLLVALGSGDAQH